MKERGILMSAPMVRALLDGSKTQTRRVMQSQPYSNGFHFDGRDILCHNDYLPPAALLMDVKRGKDRYTVSDVEGDLDLHCPYGTPGDRLWVRETHLYVGPGSGSDLPSYREERARVDNHKPEHCWYRADGERPEIKWTPAIHMFRGNSRITLEVVGVRVERLQAISEADAQAEGCAVECMTPTGDDNGSAIHNPGGYIALWESINGAGSWTANPWVWVVEFRRI